MKRKALVESCGVILDRHPFFVKNKDLLGSLDRSVQSQERATFEILVGKAEPLLSLPLLFDIGRLVYLRLPCGVVLDEVFKLRHLVVRQLPKLQTTSPWRHRNERHFSYLKIRNGFNRHLRQIKAMIGKYYA